MIKRNAYKNLLEWKDKTNRKPLIIRGARQVGKTSLVREFSKEFKCYVELNLEKENLRRLFDIDNVDKILNAAFLITNVIPSEGSTLIFLDEIQESPKAIKLLRYFYEERPDLYVVAAGSLLEFAIKEVPSFPVGRIDYLYLHPLNFQEYLLGLNQTAAINILKEMPVPDYTHPILLNLFNNYAIIGGMPEILAGYIKNNNIANLQKDYTSIWQSYKDDVEKYGRNNTLRSVIRFIIEKAPFEKDRISFSYFGGSNYKSREVGEALHALDLAKIIRLIYPTTHTEPPVLPDLKKRPRLQFLDTGLLNQILQIQAEMIPLNDLCDFHRGRIIQHLIIQEIISLNIYDSKPPYFWVRESKDANSEVDLVLQYRNLLIPIEIKAGKSGTLRSLHQFMERTNHPYSVRMYAGEFSIDKLTTPAGKKYFLMNLPYYLSTKIEDYLKYFIEKYPIKGVELD